MIDKVDGNRIASDSHTYLIALFKAIQSGWTPPDEISESDYMDAKNNPHKYPQSLVGFIGFGCSYSGKWFSGYARGNDKNGNPRNYCKESKDNILNQFRGLQGINIYNKSYDYCPIPSGSIIYCDPPYKDTTSYKHKFDHVLFFDWCRYKVKEGHSVFISEYNAPDDFVCVWEKKVNNTLVKQTGSKQGIEKLFVHESQLHLI